MVTLTLLTNVVLESIALLILLYIVFSLIKADQKYVKQHIMQHYELMKRDRVFRKSLFILAISLVFTVAASAWIIYNPLDLTIIGVLRSIAAVFRIIFFVYLIGVVRATKT